MQNSKGRNRELKDFKVDDVIRLAAEQAGQERRLEQLRKQRSENENSKLETMRRYVRRKISEVGEKADHETAPYLITRSAARKLVFDNQAYFDKFFPPPYGAQDARAASAAIAERVRTGDRDGLDARLEAAISAAVDLAKALEDDYVRQFGDARPLPWTLDERVLDRKDLRWKREHERIWGEVRRIKAENGDPSTETDMGPASLPLDNSSLRDLMIRAIFHDTFSGFDLEQLERDNGRLAFLERQLSAKATTESETRLVEYRAEYQYLLRRVNDAKSGTAEGLRPYLPQTSRKGR